MLTRIFATLSLVAAFAVPVIAQQRDAQGPLSAARDLYASARYDEALAVLNGMRPSPDEAAPDRKSIEQYRSLCLLALGRGPEAEAAIAAVVTVDPLFQPNESDASPRVRSAFSDVRQRLLPDIASARYATAKAAFDRREFATAERQFRDLVTLLTDPQMGGRLGDLRILATGFLDLSSAAAAPAPAPAPPAPAPAPRKEAAAAPPPPSAPATPMVPRIYSPADTEVTPPVTVKQEVPKVQIAIMNQARERGVLEVVIDEQGRVVNLTLRTSLHPLYDPLLLAAARDWRYQPARLNGVPVKYRKAIQIVLSKH